MVADERDLPVGLVRGAVDPRARLAPEAADLVRRRGAEAAAEVLVEEQAHLVALDGQRREARARAPRRAVNSVKKVITRDDGP